MQGKSKLVSLKSMANRLGISYEGMRQKCTVGKVGVSGVRVQLERRMTARGWATSQEMLEDFERKLNDPRYGQ